MGNAMALISQQIATIAAKAKQYCHERVSSMSTDKGDGMFDFLKTRITLPDMEEASLTPKVLRIRIHDNDKLSNEDFGRVAAAYVRANNLEGYPIFNDSQKSGVFEFVVAPTEEELAIVEEARKIHEANFDKKVLELVKVEIVTPRM